MTSQQSFWSRYALTAALGIPTAAVICFGSNAPQIWTLIALCSYIALAVLLAAAALGKVHLHWHPILWPALVFGTAVFAQLLFAHTAYRAATLDGALQLTADFSVLYLGLFAFRNQANLLRLGTAAWVSAGALGAEALAQFFTSGGHIYWYRDARYGTPVGPFVYHNHFAGCMDLLLPLAFAWAFRPTQNGRSDEWLSWIRRALLPSLGVAAVVVSQSRGGLFAITFEALLSIFVFRRLIRARALLLLLPTFALVVSFTALAGWRPVLLRLHALEFHEVSALDRVRATQACLAIWRSHPWLGTGFGTFEAVYPEYETFDSGQRWDAAHDDYAQTLAETGLVGLTAAACFLLMLFARTLTGPGDKTAPGKRWLVRRAALIGCAGFAFHSIGDFEFHCPANALLFFLLAAAAVSTAREARARAQDEAPPTHLAHRPTPRRAVTQAETV